jgi:hypothetical protein
MESRNVERPTGFSWQELGIGILVGLVINGLLFYVEFGGPLLFLVNGPLKALDPGMMTGLFFVFAYVAFPFCGALPVNFIAVLIILRHKLIWRVVGLVAVWLVFMIAFGIYYQLLINGRVPFIA